MPTFATPRPIGATVAVAGAQVRVAASDRADTVVLVEPIKSASQRDMKVARKTRVEFSGGQLTVKTTVPGDKDGSVAITIDVPVGSSLVAYLAHSSLLADGPLDKCELHMASGRETSAGQIWIGNASADLDLSNGGGGFDIDRADGSVVVDANSKQGSVRTSIPSRQDPDTSDDKVTVHARTRRGDIIIQRAAS